MTPQDKALLYGLVVTVALLVSQVATLQSQMTTLEQDIVELEGLIPKVPDALNYTATDAVSNYAIDTWNVVDGGYLFTMGGPETIVKGVRQKFSQITDWTSSAYNSWPETQQVGWSGRAITWVFVIHYDGFNATEALAGIGIESGMPVNNLVFNATIVGNCVEFSYMNHIFHPSACAYLTIVMSMPVGEYTVIQYFRA